MQHPDNEPIQSFAWFRQDDDGSSEQTFFGTGHRIQPGTAVPPVVLVTNLGDGPLVLQTWRDGLRAYLSPADAVPLRRVLSAIFENTALALRTEQQEAR